MNAELKKNVINMKHLSQDIDDPIVVNAADANGRTLEIIFTQEAAAQLTPETKVYLSWYHQQQKIKGYNVFTYVPGDNPKRDPYRWKIFYPQSMLYCGDVLACIEIVDDVSIAASNNFMIHVLEDPNDGTPFVVSDDFTEFKNAVIALATLQDTIEAEWEHIQEEHQYILEIVDDATVRLNDVEDLLAQIQEDINNGLIPRVETLEDTAALFENRISILEETSENWTNAIAQAKQEAIEQADIYAGMTITKTTGGALDNYLYRYTINQGGEPVENGVIDIYKDKVATDGEIVFPDIEHPITIDGQTITTGAYIRIDIANTDPVYIDITDLSGFTISSTDEITVSSLNDNITLNINKISGSKIIYREEDMSVTPTVAEQTVNAAIDELNSIVATSLVWEVLTPTN